jgi:predicted ArsR family transcriptional regulator
MSTRHCCEILKAIRDEPMSAEDLAKHMGLTRPTITYHLAYLESEGIVMHYNGDKKATGPHIHLYTVSKRWRNK